MGGKGSIGAYGAMDPVGANVMQAVSPKTAEAVGEPRASEEDRKSRRAALVASGGDPAVGATLSGTKTLLKGA